MSWSASEYLHLVLSANKGVALPAPTLWLLRHAKFRTLAEGDYAPLLDGFDRSMLPWLADFQVQMQDNTLNSLCSAFCPGASQPWPVVKTWSACQTPAHIP